MATTGGADEDTAKMLPHAKMKLMTTRGRYLVATPALNDPNFELTVLFMLEHSEEGALGVVLNRPSELPVAGTIDEWSDLTAEPKVVFVGGPVSPSSVIALATVQLDDAGPHWNQVVGRLGTVDLEVPPSEVPGVEQVRMFAGYASWAPGQLEAELVDDAWFVIDAELQDVHTDDPAELWWTVLDRQPGELGRLRHYPREPWHN